jgi:hypothetical protein
MGRARKYADARQLFRLRNATFPEKSMISETLVKKITN